MLNLNFDPFPVLNTERLLLRRFTFADAPRLFELRKDPVIMQYISRPLAKTLDDAIDLIKVINDLLKKYSIDQLDLLMLDTEGYDGDIIIDFLSTTSLKPLIIFEYIHIKQDTFKNLIKLLNIKKYQYFKIEENVICFPIDLNNEKKIFN